MQSDKITDPTVAVCKCGNQSRPGQRTCWTCHAEYMRNFRKTRFLTPSERFKMNCRSYLHVYIRRGKIAKKPCEVCGNPEAESHHQDYSKPLDVRWLCRVHHLELDGKLVRKFG